MSSDSVTREIGNLIDKIRGGNIDTESINRLINGKMVSGRLPLVVAAAWCSIDDIRFLIESGAHVDAMEDDWGNALMEAAAHGRNDVVEYLLLNGAKIDAQTTQGDTALIAAAGHGQLLAIEKLLEWKANASIRNERGGNAESTAGEKGHAQCEEILARYTQRT